MLIYFGQYTGTGANKTVFTGSPAQTAKFVHVKRDGVSNAVFQTDTSNADSTQPLALAGTGAGSLVLNSDGSFTVNNNSTVGANATAYHYIAIYDNSAGDIFTTKYTGNGTNPRSFTGYGFAPAVAFVKDAASVAGAFRTLNHTSTNSSRFNSNADSTTAITALGADGISVNTTMNVNLTVYYVIAFKNAQYGNYTGTGGDDRDITTTSYPLWVTTKTSDNTGAATFRTTADADDSSAAYGATGYAADSIQRFGSVKFQVGTNLNVNANTKVYQWVAIGVMSINKLEGNLFTRGLIN